MMIIFDIVIKVTIVDSDNDNEGSCGYVVDDDDDE